MTAPTKTEIQAAQRLAERFLGHLQQAVEELEKPADKFVRKKNLAVAELSLDQVVMLLNDYPFLKFHDLPKVERYIKEQAAIINALFVPREK